MSKKKAFSTAELMIAIAVMGALAAMMIPSLRYSVNKAVFNHSREIQRQKLAQGITLLSIRSPRMGFQTTESFV